MPRIRDVGQWPEVSRPRVVASLQLRRPLQTRDISHYGQTAGTTAITNHMIYDSFGNITSEANPSDPQGEPTDHLFGFTGRPFEEATALQNNVNRWYDAAIGQWLSEDPIGFEAGDTNLRNYVEGDPTNSTDATGLARDLQTLLVYYEAMFPDDGLLDAYLHAENRTAQNERKYNRITFVDKWRTWRHGSNRRPHTDVPSTGYVIEIDPDIDIFAQAYQLRFQIKEITRKIGIGRRNTYHPINLQLARKPEGYLQQVQWNTLAYDRLANYLDQSGLVVEIAVRVVNEPLDWVLTVKEVAEGDIYAASGVLLFVPGAVSKAKKLTFRMGRESFDISGDVARVLQKLPIEQQEEITRRFGQTLRRRGLTGDVSKELEEVVALVTAPRKAVSLPHTKQLTDYLYKRIGADDIVDAHHAAHHSMPRAKQAEIVNDWDQFVRGKNYNGKEVDVFMKDGRVVITEAGDKTKVITAYGREFSVTGKPVDPKRWNFRFWQDNEFYFSPIHRNTQR